MGGTSGALYSVFFAALGSSLPPSSNNNQNLELTAGAWHHALHVALQQLYACTRARPPSRTLMDPLVAFVEGFAKTGGTFDAAVGAACAAAEETKNLEAKAGRSAYVDSDRLKERRVPDPGAWGVRVILKALLNEPQG
jgi:triose/dihydroxyacetone kinase / FAD-AMP lyase (cyclizing)